MRHQEVTYTKGKAIFSDNTLNNKTQYGVLVLREDGVYSISEELNGRVFKGGGAWEKTEHPNIISVGLSSNSPMTIYHFYVLLNKDTETYVVSEKNESLIEL